MLQLLGGIFMFVSPMLLQKSNHPFDDEFYITELKVDGIRTLGLNSMIRFVFIADTITRSNRSFLN